MSPEPRHLHRAGIAVFALGTLREAAVPLLVLFGLAVLGEGFDADALIRGALYAAVGTVVATVAGFVRWRTTTWRVSPEAIHHRRGFLRIKETDVPLNRVQALDLEQGPVQRLFGVQSVHVQTGGGGAKGEIVLEAVGAEDVAALQALVGGHGAAPAAARPEAEARLARGMLLVAALTAGQVGILLPVLAGAGQMLESVAGRNRGEDALRLLPDAPTEWLLAGSGLLAAAWLLSALGAVVAFAGFTVARDGDRLRIRRGLLARREATVPVDRVRAVSIVEGVLRQPFGLAALRVEVIGHAKEATAAQTLFPLVRVADVQPFLERFLPELADDPGGLARPPGRSLRRYVLPPAAAGLVAGGLAWAFAPVGPWTLAVALPCALYGALQFRAAGWRLADDRLAIRSLRLARTTVLGPARNRESHAVAQNLLQRRGSLADLEVAFGKSTGARVRHLELAAAAEAWDRLSEASAGAGPRPRAAT